MPEKVFTWKAVNRFDGTTMIFCAFGDNVEQARSRLLEEYQSLGDNDYKNLIGQIAASEPLLHEVKNGTFGIQVNLRVA